jgi:hypothetical protein
MSFLSSVIFPELEKHLIELTPDLADLALEELKQWIEAKGNKASEVNPEPIKEEG